MTKNGKAIKVLQLTSGVNYAGAEKTIKYLKQYLPSKYKVEICVTNESSAFKEFSKLRLSPKVCGNGSILNPKTWIDLYKYIKNNDFKIINTHGFRDSVLSRILNLMLRDVIVINTYHGLLEYAKLPFPKSVLYPLLDRITFKYSDLYIAVSEAIKKDLVNFRSGRKEKIYVIPNCEDPDNIKANVGSDEIRRKLGVGKKEFLIGIAARIHEQKNHQMLIRVAQKLNLPDVRFAIVGDGPLFNKIKNLVIEKELTNKVIMTGYRSDVYNVIDSFDAVIMTSKWEGLPWFLVEAMAFGKPIIATDVMGIREMIVDGENGLLVQLDDVESMSNKIRVLYNSPKLRKKLGENARNTFLANYSIDVMVRKIDDMYQNALSKYSVSRS